jgi:hypothetical protein
MTRLIVGLVGLFCLGGVALAVHIEADPGKDYHVTPEAGGWLICVSSFTGENAPQLAHEMVLLIRRDYQLPAYIMDRGKEERLRQQAELAKKRELYPGVPLKGYRIDEQVAVLVGGYKDMDEARKALDGIRKWKRPPDKFCVMGDRVQPGDKGVLVEQVRISPFQTAFVAHNPSVPREKEALNKADRFMIELNDGESLSLLKNCKKPWTLAVQVFQGKPMVLPQHSTSSIMDKFRHDDHVGEQLNAAALNAHNLAELLRKLNFDAYVLHTRNSSIVTVGGYDTANDPKLLLTQKTLAKMQCKDKNNGRVIAELFVQPLPMEVPKP